DDVRPVSEFDAREMQDPSSLLSNGGRKDGRCYINNFFFFPAQVDARAILLGWLRRGPSSAFAYPSLQPVE
ncbi:hypothetical protein, partial [Stenotrophomonas maltophilia]|uniref:hypothetical protein n=1 Tax=Stenotrophomonas maltophilia TaxID=40324 RepID=UPI001953DBDC